MILPWLFGTKCDCATRVIEYLEEEKYEWVPRRFTKKQLTEVNEFLDRAHEQIKENPYLTDTRKEIMRSELNMTAFYKKVLKKHDR